MVKKIIRFVSHDIWELDLYTKSKFTRFLIQTAKVLLLAFKGIQEDKVALRASALTFFTLLSIVPVIALAFGLAKGFGLDNVLEQQILEKFQGQEEVFKQSINFAKNLLSTTKGGIVAGFGLMLLFYTVMKLLNNIEDSFNDIWYVTKQRNITRKLTDYITIMLFGPVLMILANGLTVFIAGQIEYLTNTVELIKLFKVVIFPLLSLLPLTVIWLLFTLIYMIMPNTTVQLKPAVVAGVIAGTLYQVVQLLLFKLEVNVSHYNAIYGSFAALPLFLIWLQFSWMIVLYGSEISYAIQNVNTYENSIKSEGFSIRFKKKIALAASLVIIKNFKEGGNALSAEELDLKVPNKLLHEVLEVLVGAHILSITINELGIETYQPAEDTDKLSIHYIISRFERHGRTAETEHQNSTLKLAHNTLSEIEEVIESNKVNKLLKEI